MPLGPTGANFQQLLVSGPRFIPSSAIAEYPGADVGYFFLFTAQLKGDAGAIDGILAPAVVQQCFTEPTVKDRKLVRGNLVLGEMEAARLQQAELGCARTRGGIDCLFTDFTKFAHLCYSRIRLNFQ
jgi:hypothetical protein